MLDRFQILLRLNMGKTALLSTPRKRDAGGTRHANHFHEDDFALEVRESCRVSVLVDKGQIGIRSIAFRRPSWWVAGPR
jgi:hypothetical protein